MISKVLVQRSLKKNFRPSSDFLDTHIPQKNNHELLVEVNRNFKILISFHTIAAVLKLNGWKLHSVHTLLFDNLVFSEV